MIEEIGRIVAVRDDRIWVQTERQTSCGSCAAQAGCGQGLFSRMSQRSHNHIELVTGEVVEVGDRVVLGIAEHTLIKSSLWAYGLPLLLMIGTAVVAETILGIAEPWVIVAALSSLAAGMLVSRMHSFNADRQSEYQPVLVRVLGREGAAAAAAAEAPGG